MVISKRTSFAFLSILMLLTACAADVDQRHFEKASRMTWPGGNVIQRIMYIDSLARPIDIGITPSFLEKIWNYIVGEPDQSIESPYGVGKDGSGRIYVVDSALRTVHVFDETNKEYHTFSPDDPGFESPIDIAIDRRRDVIYVTDSTADAIFLFTDAGRKMAGVLKNAEMERPTGIAVNPATDELLVVDTIKCSVFRFDLETHVLKGVFGSKGTADGEFNFPTNISVAGDGTILVTDSMNFRVQLFSSEGVFTGKFGESGDTPGYFTKPKGIASDSDGHIYVVDSLQDTVQIFDRDGQLLMNFGTSGYDEGKFWLPSGIYIDSDDRIYVSDTYNKRLQIFQYLK